MRLRPCLHADQRWTRGSVSRHGELGARGGQRRCLDPPPLRRGAARLESGVTDDPVLVPVGRAIVSPASLRHWLARVAACRYSSPQH